MGAAIGAAIGVDIASAVAATQATVDMIRFTMVSPSSASTRVDPVSRHVQGRAGEQRNAIVAAAGRLPCSDSKSLSELAIETVLVHFVVW